MCVSLAGGGGAMFFWESDDDKYTLEPGKLLKKRKTFWYIQFAMDSVRIGLNCQREHSHHIVNLK